MKADSKIIKIKKLLAEDYGENHGLLVDDIKRVIYKFFLLFLPKHIKMNGFCLVFCKNNSK